MVERGVSSSRRAAVHPIPVWRRAAYGLCTCAFLLVALESSLYLGGIERVPEHRDPYVSFAGRRPLFVASGPAGKWRVTAPERRRYFNAQQFLAEKPLGGKRIFCLGGSTTYGHPYDDRTSFCGWLRALLTEVDPENRWEVVNAGGISYASYRVAALMEELGDLSPDVFIVLTGHNEFLEARSYPRLLQHLPSSVLGLASLASSSRSFALVHRVLHGSGAEQAPGVARLPMEVDALLDHSIGLSAYTRDDERRSGVLAHFELNLRRMEGLARSVGAELLWVVPASNLRDCAPFKSAFDPALSESEQQSLSKRVLLARTAQAAGRYALAAARWSDVLELDPAYSEALYQLGHVQFLRGHEDEARALWSRARDTDVCPLRAPSGFQAAIHDVARESGSMLVDFPLLLERLAEQRSYPASPGAELFLDHVHPTPEVHGILAEAILGELVRTGRVQASRPLEASIREKVQAAIATARSPRQEGIALRNLAKVLSWAGKTPEAARLARQAIQTLGPDAESAFILGAAALEREDDRAAQRWFTRTLELDPNYAKAHTNLGIVLGRLGDRTGARTHYDAALSIEPASASALYQRAGLAFDEGDYVGAIRDYEQAAALDPDDLESRVELARTLFRSGDRAGAFRAYRRLERLPGLRADERHRVRHLARELGL